MNETTLYFNPTTKVIFASADPQSSDMQVVTLDHVTDLIDDGATIDSSAATVIDAAADATKAPAVATPGEGDQGADASGGTDTPAASGGDAPLDASAAATSPTAVATSTESSTGSSAASDASTDSDSGNVGASDAAAASGNVSGATAADASDLSGTGAGGTETAGITAGTADPAAIVTIAVGGSLVASYAASTVEDAVQQAAAAYPSSAHPVHEIFALIEVELSQPTGLIKNEIKKLLNRGRAMF